MRVVRIAQYASLLIIAGMILAATAPGLSLAQDDQRCFPETGYCISGTIRTYWEANGGLSVFGYPLGEQHEEMIEGAPYQVQVFERNRLEIHPENAGTLYHVLLGRLGATPVDAAVAANSWTPPAAETQKDGCVLFSTGWNVCGDILKTFLASGLEMSDGKAGLSADDSVALFGLPVTPQVTMDIDGKQYTVQWFERARFELHPENEAPYNVLLGLLGKETAEGTNQAPALAVAEDTGTPQPTETPQPVETPIPSETPQPIPSTVPQTTPEPASDLAGTYRGTFTSDDAVQGGQYTIKMTIARNATSASLNISGENVSGEESYFYTSIAAVQTPDANTVVLIFKDGDSNEIKATLTREGTRLHGTWSYTSSEHTATGTIDVTRSE